jgi:predicted dehydrogenase/threonine dehydrogenase-like Zn-dependent dehydrogenase
MKQVLQNLKTGETQVMDVPAPICNPLCLLISTRCSLISAGTERTLVEFGQANLLAKAKAQPERVREVLAKIKTDGLMPTLETVFARLDQPLPLGYCNAGEVMEVGEGVTGFRVGDRVISNGPHAEIVCVPKNLCARIPPGVGDDEAAFTVLAAVGLQGVRLAAPTLGENVVVTGLGLIGLLTVQMLVANGCRVLGIDFDPHRLALARQFGAKTVDLSSGSEPVIAAMAFADGRGVDAVVITASTKSNEPVHQAAQMCRKRGRIVLVGVAGLELVRHDFYEKELSFQVSCSYGPGRYDDAYEQKGNDYPFGLVRWTEQRNFEAVLEMMEAGKLKVEPLISGRMSIAQAPDAYRRLTGDHTVLGLLLTSLKEGRDPGRVVAGGNSNARWGNQSRRVLSAIRRPQSSSPAIGVIGAGNFASLIMLPALKKTAALFKTIASGNDPSAAVAARKFGFQNATSDYRTILTDQEISAVFIATRHDIHARIVVEALNAGKHIFVEKPLALTRAELAEVRSAYQESIHPQLLVGYNRRFSPLAVKMHTLLAGRSQPLSLVYTINAGAIPSDHWTQNPMVGGGRIIGEGCHFIDFLRFLVGQPLTGIEARMMGRAPGIGISEDKMMIILEFADGSLGTVLYLANGSKQYPKEQVKVFSQGRVLVLDNFKALRGYGWSKFRKTKQWRQDKGHTAEIAAFVDRITTGGEPLIPWSELEETSLATFAAVERAQAPARCP